MNLNYFEAKREVYTIINKKRVDSIIATHTFFSSCVNYLI